MDGWPDHSADCFALDSDRKEIYNLSSLSARASRARAQAAAGERASAVCFSTYYSSFRSISDRSAAARAAGVEDPGVLSWPVPRVVSDVYMCTNARASGSRDPSSPLYIHLGSLNHLCTEPLSPVPAVSRSAVSISFSPQEWEDIPIPRASSSLRSVQGERDAVKVQPSFLKRARSIVRSFSKGITRNRMSQTIYQRVGRGAPFALAEKERTRETLRSLDKVSRRHNEEAAASGKLADVSISYLRRAQCTVTREARSRTD